MTNSLRQFALKSFAASLLSVILCGCGSDPAKDYAKGKEAFDNADYKTAVECFTDVVENSPDNVDALVMLARSEFALGNLDAADAAIKKVSSSSADDVDVVELTAQIAFYRKDYKASADAYKKLVLNHDLDPSIRSIGWTGLGIIDFVKIDIEPQSARLPHEARVKFLQAIMLDRRNSSAHFHLGYLYRDAFHCYDAAKEEFSLFLHLEKSVDDRVKRVKNEVLPSLEEEIKKRAQTNVSRIDTVGCASMLRKGDDFFRRGKLKDAADAYAKALKANPASYQAAMGQARSYVRLNRNRSDREQALTAYLTACKIRSYAIATYIEAADFALRIGNTATAVRLYSQALAASPTSVKAVQGLIDSLTKSGDIQAASVYRGYLRTLSRTK